MTDTRFFRRTFWHTDSMKLRLIIAFALLPIAAVSNGCATITRAETVAAGTSKECVVLLHGLNRSWRMMRPMAESLQEAGFSTVNIDYPSQSGPIEEIAPVAVGLGLDQCRETGASSIHFVTHSMGGILLRYQNKHAPIDDLGRVVMLGPPNQGSELIDETRDWPGFRIFTGEAGAQLGTSAEGMPVKLGPVDFELGVIAGTGTVNIITSAMLPSPNDGKVSVEKTQVDGMDDFLIVDNSHRYITRSDVVIRNTESFLRNGSFIAGDKALMTP